MLERLIIDLHSNYSVFLEQVHLPTASILRHYLLIQFLKEERDVVLGPVVKIVLREIVLLPSRV